MSDQMYDMAKELEQLAWNLDRVGAAFCYTGNHMVGSRLQTMSKDMGVYVGAMLDRYDEVQKELTMSSYRGAANVLLATLALSPITAVQEVEV